MADYVDWTAGMLETRWESLLLYLRWTMGYSTVTISHLSTEYVLVPVAATKEGSSYNPTGDVVTMAFMPNAVQQPGVSDWQTASWDTDTSDILYPYSVKCLVGPAGVITLVQGSYSIYVKIVDNPETPVLSCGQLVIS